MIQNTTSLITNSTNRAQCLHVKQCHDDGSSGPIDLYHQCHNGKDKMTKQAFSIRHCILGDSVRQLVMLLSVTPSRTVSACVWSFSQYQQNPSKQTSKRARVVVSVVSVKVKVIHVQAQLHRNELTPQSKTKLAAQNMAKTPPSLSQGVAEAKV